MTVKSMVGTLTRTGVSTAVSVVRHPIGSASLAVGLVKGAAEAGVHVVRTAISGQPPAPDRVVGDQVRIAEQPPGETSEPAPAPAPHPAATADPRDNIPGPDLAAFEPPAPEDLPEPIVIVADPEGPGEAFHNEPKAASRDSEHGDTAGDQEEAAGYVDEIVLDDTDLEIPAQPDRR